MYPTRQLAVCLCLLWSATVSGDIVPDGAFRYVTTEAEILGDNGGHEAREFATDEFGAIEIELLSVVDRGSEGFGRGWGTLTSDFSVAGFSATANAGAEISLGGAFEEGSASGIILLAGDFHVDTEQTYRLEASIAWAGGPSLCVVKLREINGDDLFVLETDGDSGTGWRSADVLLMPGKRYELLAFAGDVAHADAPFESEALYAEYAFDLHPIPASPSAVVLFIAGLTARRRTRAS